MSVETEVAAWGLKQIAIAIGVVSALIVGSWFVWHFVLGPRAAIEKSKEVGTGVAVGLGAAGTQSGKQAVEITVKNQSQAAGIDRETQKAIHDLLKAPGADQPVDPALSALARRAICMRASAASSSTCRALLGSAPGGVAPEGR